MNKSTLKSPFTLLVYFLKKSSVLFVLTILMSIILVGLGIGVPWVMRIIIDDFLRDSSLDPTLRYEGFTLFMFYYVGLVMLQIALRYIHGILNALIGMRMERDLRSAAFHKLGRLPVSYFTTITEGEIVHRIETDSAGLRNYYGVLYALIDSVINIVFVYATVAVIDWRLAIAVAVIVPFFAGWMKLFGRLLKQFNEKIRANNSHVKGVINEIINHVETLQILKKEDVFLRRYGEGVERTNKLQIRLGKTITLLGYELVLLLERVVQALTLGYLALLFLGGNLIITAGLIYAVSSYIDRIMGPLHGVFNNLNALEDSIVATNRLRHFLLEEEVSDDPQAEELMDLKVPVRFDHVTFEYTANTPILKDINLTIAVGETIGIVGATGSGKSTLMNLLVQFYEPTSGYLWVGNQLMSHYSKSSYRHRLGIVLQTPSLFHGSLRDNLVLGESGFSDSELIHSLDQLGLMHLLQRDSLGLDQQIAIDGENLSVGEKQLIAFARILLRHPDLVLLDEATANIDSETEQKIQHAVNLISHQSTMVIIAHRISTIKNADRILVMDHGVITAEGTHSELVEKSALYKSMYQSQLMINKEPHLHKVLQ